MSRSRLPSAEGGHAEARRSDSGVVSDVRRVLASSREQALRAISDGALREPLDWRGLR
jgi:hypothetical protein